MNMVDTTIVTWILIWLIPITGIVMAITPYIMPKDECFTVTVPEVAQQEQYIKTLKRRYLDLVISCTILCTAIGYIYLSSTVIYNDPMLFSTIFCICMFAPLAFGLIVMLIMRSRVTRYKTEQNWQTTHDEAQTVLGDTQDIPRPLSLRWNLLYIPVILATTALAIAIYPSTPAQIPWHADMAGNITYADKTPFSMAFPVLIQIFLSVILFVSQLAIVHSKRATIPGRARQSLYAYGRFARAQSIMLLVGGLILSASMGMLFLMAASGILNLTVAGIILMVIAVAFVIGEIILGVRFGQSGARLMKAHAGSSQDGELLMRDDDRFWKLGIIYVNKDDPAAIVPKRFGVGWTCNMGNVKSWLIIAALVALVVVFVIACTMLA